MLARSARPTAVTVAAIIGIVIASLFVLCIGISLLMEAVASPADKPQVPGWVAGTQVAFALLSMLLFVAWIVICVGLLTMSGWARSAGLTLATAHVLILLVTTGVHLGLIAQHLRPALEVAIEREQARQAEASGNTTTTGPTTLPDLVSYNSAMATGLAYGLPVIGLVLGLILPVMMLIVLTRPSVKAAFAGAGTEIPPTHPPPPM
jgi:hypothetical protein